MEISPKAVPQVCRIIDFQKFIYQKKKKEKEQKAKATKITIKEIRFGPQTDDHDYNFKLKHAIEFLKEGSKVKAYVFFKGRSILFKEQGELLLLRFAKTWKTMEKWRICRYQRQKDDYYGGSIKRKHNLLSFQKEIGNR